MHVIRLRKPWLAQWCSDAVQLPGGTSSSASGGSQLDAIPFSDLHSPDVTALFPHSPFDASSVAFRTACYRRAFNRPTGLTPGQSVAIVLRRLEVQSHMEGRSEEEGRSGVEGRSRRGASGHIACHAISLNRQFLMLETKGNRSKAEIGLQLEPFNQLEIFCQLSESAATEPPELTDFMEISIEIS